MISHSTSFPCCQSFDPLPGIRQRRNRYRKQASWSREEWADKSNTISNKLPKNQQMNVWLLNLWYRESGTEQVQWEWLVFPFSCIFKPFSRSFFSFEGLVLFLRKKGHSSLKLHLLTGSEVARSMWLSLTQRRAGIWIVLILCKTKKEPSFMCSHTCHRTTYPFMRAHKR